MYKDNVLCIFVSSYEKITSLPLLRNKIFKHIALLSTYAQMNIKKRLNRYDSEETSDCLVFMQGYWWWFVSGQHRLAMHCSNILLNGAYLFEKIHLKSPSLDCVTAVVSWVPEDTSQRVVFLSTSIAMSYCGWFDYFAPLRAFSKFDVINFIGSINHWSSGLCVLNLELIFGCWFKHFDIYILLLGFCVQLRLNYSSRLKEWCLLIWLTGSNYLPHFVCFTSGGQ